MSTWVAQFTAGSYFSATSSEAIGTIERVAEAVTVEVVKALTALPPTFWSVRIISLMPS